MKTTALYFIVGMPDMLAARECPQCGFDAVLDFPLTSLSLNGVGPAGTITACARCHDEREGK